MIMNQLISSHLVKGLLKLNTDFTIFLFPVIELSDKQFQLLLELGGLTLSGGGLDFCKLEIQDQISDLLLSISGRSERHFTSNFNLFFQGVHALIIDKGNTLKVFSLNLHSFSCSSSLSQLSTLDLETAVGTGDIVVEKRESTLES